MGAETKRMAFMQGGGEMGELIRLYDWSGSVIGEPDQWPQSLRTMLGLMLHSAFPMFLFWGKELTCFYNDAFRPSLGIEGKHPLLGKKGMEAWPEIWDFIGPLIEQVRTTGQSVWFENQLVPFYRNGKIEDIYWTFSYSPAYGDGGEIDGVFVACTETTETIRSLRRVGESEERFRTMAEGSDILIALADEKSHATYFNKAWTDLTGRPMEDLLNLGWADLIHPEDRDQFIKVYLGALAKQASFTGEFRVKNKDGGYSWLLARGPARFRSDGSFAGHISSSLDITEQVRALQRVRDSELNLRNTVLGAPMGICILDASTLVSEIVNDSFIEVAGKPYEEIAGKYYWDTFAEARPYYEAALDGVVREGVPFYANEVELMLIRHGKEEIIYVTFVYSPLKDAAGKVEKIAIWVLENTSQVVARRRIEEAEAKARLAIDSAELGVYEIDYAREILTGDARFNEIWGVDHATNSRKDYVSAIHPDDMAGRAIAHEASVRSGQLDYQARIIWKDGSVHWTKISGKVMYDDNGRPLKLIGVAQDITASVTARRKIEESEKSIRTMIVQAPVAMCIFRGPSYTVEVANNKMFELWGKRPGEVMGRPIFEGLPEAKEQGLEALLHHVFKTGERFEASERPVMLPRNGKMELVYVNFVYEALQNSDHITQDILAVAINVTDQVVARRKIEEVVTERTKELAEANARLTRSNDDLAQFAYIASHDLQEPVRKITTYLQMLEKSFADLNELQNNYFNKIGAAGKRMRTLIRDVLTFSELSKGNNVFEKVDLFQVASAVKFDFDLLIEQKAATVEIDGLPVIEAIPLQMGQLFGNLLSNALKFTRENVRPDIRIHGRLLSAEEIAGHPRLNPEVVYHKIEFRDNGIGFQSEYAQKIFHIFQRLHAKSEFAGTGIGLAMCKKIAQNHQGEIYAESGKEGTVFNLIIPAKQADAHQAIAQ